MTHLRAGTKEKCPAVFGEKLRGLSNGLLPEKDQKRDIQGIIHNNQVSTTHYHARRVKLTIEISTDFLLQATR